MDRLNGVSAEKVNEATGHTWAEWIELLDKAHAEELDHKGIVALVRQHFDRPWWSQMVAVGYEQAKGRRVKHQNVNGFQVSVTKTLDQPLLKVYNAWNEFLGQWYDGPEFTVTTNNQNKNIRGKFADGSVLAMALMSTKTGKTQVAVAQEQLSSATAAEAARGVWKRQLEQLAAFVR